MLKVGDEVKFIRYTHSHDFVNEVGIIVAFEFKYNTKTCWVKLKSGRKFQEVCEYIKGDSREGGRIWSWADTYLIKIKDGLPKKIKKYKVAEFLEKINHV